VRKAIRDVGARLIFLPEYSPTSTPSSRSSPSSKLCCERRRRKATRRSPPLAVKSSPSTRPPNAPHTSRTQDMRRPKSRTDTLGRGAKRETNRLIAHKSLGDTEPESQSHRGGRTIRSRFLRRSPCAEDRPDFQRLDLLCGENEPFATADDSTGAIDGAVGSRARAPSASDTNASFRKKSQSFLHGRATVVNARISCFSRS
jgi:hypothetical protein